MDIDEKVDNLLCSKGITTVQKQKFWNHVLAVGDFLIAFLLVSMAFVPFFDKQINIVTGADNWWDSNYGYRKNINITNNNASVPIRDEYTINFTVDTSTLVSNSKLQADGDDLRIVYWDGSSNTELDRINLSSWNDASTEIAFSLQSPIPANSYNDSNYFMYYDYGSATNPPMNKSNVYILFEGFEDTADEADPDGWTEYGDGATWKVQADGLVYDGSKSYELTDGSSGESRTYYSGNGSSWDNYTVSAWMTRPSDGGSYYDAMMYYINNADIQDYYMTGWEDTDGAGSYKHNGGYSSQTDWTANHNADEWHKFEVRIWDNTYNEFYDGVSKGSFSDSSYSKGHIGFRADQPDSGSYYYDNVIVKWYMEPIPTCTLGSEGTESVSLDTTVDDISPYSQTSSPLSISATNNGDTPDNVSLWYRYSPDNTTWGDGGESHFGYTSEETGEATLENYQVGGWYTATSGDGVADNITIYVRMTNYDGNITCGLYEYTDYSSSYAGNLIASTEEKSFNGETATAWYTFNFTTDDVYITNDTKYYIVAHAESASGGVLFRRHSNAGIDVYENVAYSSTLQDPWAGEASSSFERCIYLNYTINGSTWTKYGTDTNGADGWSWSFNFPDGDGYYEFYSIANKTGYENESAPATNDTLCQYTSSADTQDPSISFNFAGNLSGSGGPYYVPETDTAASDGFIVNDSRQQEDWIYINCTVTDDVSVDEVWLHWKNESTWTNNSYQFSNTAGNYYEYNTSGNIVVSSGYNYSFDIWANDTSNNITTYSFTKRDANNNTGQRITFQLDCSQTNISYTPFYLYHADYADTGSAYGPGYNQYDADILHHDQGPDGTNHDTGYLLSTLPTDTVENVNCIAYTGLWFDESICPIPDTIENVYQHLWWNTDDDEIEFGTGFHDGALYRMENFENRYNRTHTDAVSNVTYTGDAGNVANDVWRLEAKLNSLSTTYTIDDNNIYEFFIEQYTENSPNNDEISIMSNRSFMSFILFNVPDNATLQGQDSDSDGLNDWEELYITYTHPIISDTDNDGVTDYDENMSGSDPNNYTDTLEYETWQTISNTVGEGALGNTTTWATISKNIGDGTLSNTTSWKSISNTIGNGTLANSTSWQTISDTIGDGNLANTTIESWQTISNTIGDGTLSHISTWQTISSTIGDGTLSNSTSWQTISDTIGDGTLSNTTTWQTISDTIGDGTLANTTTGETWQTISDTIGDGTLANTTSGTADDGDDGGGGGGGLTPSKPIIKIIVNESTPTTVSGNLNISEEQNTNKYFAYWYLTLSDNKTNLSTLSGKDFIEQYLNETFTFTFDTELPEGTYYLNAEVYDYSKQYGRELGEKTEEVTVEDSFFLKPQLWMIFIVVGGLFIWFLLKNDKIIVFKRIKK